MERKFLTAAACFALTLAFFSACKTTSSLSPAKTAPSVAQKESKLDLWQQRTQLRSYIKNQEGSTYSYRDGKVENITLGDWNSAYSFHSVNIGDDYSLVEKKLKPDFELAYRLQSVSKGFIFMEKSSRKYYLEISLDEKNRVYLINYQYDHVYSMD